MVDSITLRSLRTSDASEMAEVLADPRLYSFIGGEPPSESDLERRYAVQTRGHSADGRETWLNYVVTRPDGSAVGYVQATIPTTGGAAEIAWVIGAPWQRRGFARHAAELLREELRDRGVLQLMAHIHPDNEASQHIARRLGMRPTSDVQDGEVRWEGPIA